MPPNQQFTESEIQRMRMILAQHDNAVPQGINSFDLNNPPRKQYRHEEWPQIVYNEALRKDPQKRYRLVHNERELEAALADGYSTEPFSEEPEEPRLDAASQAQVAMIERVLQASKDSEPRRGRPANAR